MEFKGVEGHGSEVVGDPGKVGKVKLNLGNGGFWSREIRCLNGAIILSRSRGWWFGGSKPIQ